MHDKCESVGKFHVGLLYKFSRVAKMRVGIIISVILLQIKRSVRDKLCGVAGKKVISMLANVTIPTCLYFILSLNSKKSTDN